MDDAQVQQLRDIMWEMNAVSSSTRTESQEVDVTEVDEDGNETTPVSYTHLDGYKRQGIPFLASRICRSKAKKEKEFIRKRLSVE